MILRLHSDTSYLSEPRARSRAGGYFYMVNSTPDFINGPILTPTGVIKVVVASAAEAETAGLFTNMKEATILRTTLHEMGYPQPPTPIQVDNSTACGIANDNIKLQRSKAIDMRFHWVRDRVDQQQFKVYWRPGKTNLADYVTKHHPAAHHQLMRPIYLHQAQFLNQLKEWQASLTRSHCEGVLIPSHTRYPKPAQPEQGSHTDAPDRPARKPPGNPLATISTSKQAQLTRRLII